MCDHSVYISVGSNMGDPLSNCCRAIELLCDDAAITLVKRSSFYRTSPVDYAHQEWFINAALLIRTSLQPLDLLGRTRAVQKEMGRRSGGIRYGPRIIDLDIIFYDDRVLETFDLIIPHPRMHKRRFVLQPICDIDPTVVHPVLDMSVQKLLNQLVADGQEIEPCSSSC